MPKTSVALFDFDGTLLDGYILKPIMRYSVVHHYRFYSILGYLVSHIFLYSLNKCGLVSDERLFTRWGEDLAFIVGGLKQEEASKFFRWLVENYTLSRLRSDMVNILHQHQNQGRIVILLSTTFHELLEIVGRKLGVSYVIGTRLEMLNGEYSGKIVNPLCFGINKVSLLKELLSSIPMEVDFSNSFAYSDSIFDVPLLEMVGNPVAVYPDRKLRHLAWQRGWQLIGDGR